MVAAFGSRNKFDTFGTTAWKQVVKADPARVALVVTMFSGMSAVLSTIPGALETRGIILTSGMPRIELYFRNLGAEVGREWFAFGNGGAVSLAWHEVYYLPEHLRFV